MSTFIYIIQLIIYGIILTLYFVYSFLQFLSKPGTRFLFPCAIICLIIWQRDLVHAIFKGAANGLFGRHEVNTYIAWGLLIVVLFLVGWSYVFLSRALALVLGIFPPISRPLMPVRKLEAPRAATTRPAPVHVAVPPLPRRR